MGSVVDNIELLKCFDSELWETLGEELERQLSNLELVSSENIVSEAFIVAMGSVLTNKYAEGYPHSKYYGGCEFVDEVENIAIDRIKKLFGVNFANVQQH